MLILQFFLFAEAIDISELFRKRGVLKQLEKKNEGNITLPEIPTDSYTTESQTVKPTSELPVLPSTPAPYEAGQLTTESPSEEETDTEVISDILDTTTEDENIASTTDASTTEPTTITLEKPTIVEFFANENLSKYTPIYSETTPSSIPESSSESSTTPIPITDNATESTSSTESIYPIKEASVKVTKNTDGLGRIDYTYELSLNMVSDQELRFSQEKLSEFLEEIIEGAFEEFE